MNSLSIEQVNALVEAARALPAPQDNYDANEGCAYCSFDLIDGDINIPDNHAPDCPWRRLKEMVETKAERIAREGIQVGEDARRMGLGL